MPELDIPRESKPCKDETEAAGNRLGNDNEASPVNAVGNDPAHERQGKDGYCPDETGEAEIKGRAGQLVDLPDIGHALHLRTHPRNYQRGVEQPEVPMSQCGNGLGDSGADVHS